MATRRIDGIDFWRGVVLAVIFVNHIPGNVLEHVTPKNFGFSDSAEAFVFLAGLSVALAYGRRFADTPPTKAAIPLVRRALQLYGAHLFLTVAGLVIFALAVRVTGHDMLLADHGRATPFMDPVRGMVGILTLGHQMGFFNILPLYVVLLAFAPLLLTIGLIDRWLMLLFSAAVYAAARSTGINLPSWPDPGIWYFNPFAWQFMFAMGLFVGLQLKRDRIPVDGSVFTVALVFCLASALVVTNVFGLVPGLVDEAGRHLDWGKTELGVARIMDFLAMAYVVYCTAIAARLRGTWIHAAASLLGRNALVVFCLGTLLSTVGQILNDTWPRTWATDIGYVAAGLSILLGVAGFLEWHRRTTVSAS